MGTPRGSDSNPPRRDCSTLNRETLDENNLRGFSHSETGCNQTAGEILDCHQRTTGRTINAVKHQRDCLPREVISTRSSDVETFALKLRLCCGESAGSRRGRVEQLRPRAGGTFTHELLIDSVVVIHSRPLNKRSIASIGRWLQAAGCWLLAARRYDSKYFGN